MSTRWTSIFGTIGIALGLWTCQEPSPRAGRDVDVRDTGQPDLTTADDGGGDVGGVDGGDGCRYPTFGAAEAVPVAGYDGVLMEPFLSRDGAYLFFNNSNDPSVDTNLHVAQMTDGAPVYVGELAGANSTALDGVASLGPDGTFYFVSTRSYDTTSSTVYRGQFTGDAVSGVELVPGVSRQMPGWVNFDAEVSADGQTLYFVDGLFNTTSGYWDSADLVIGRRDGDGFTRDPDTDVLLERVNSDVWEYAPATTADELELYFTRADPANGLAPENWMTTRADSAAPFCPPVRIDAMEGFVEASTVAADGAYVYYHHKVGSGFGLYRVPRLQ